MACLKALFYIKMRLFLFFCVIEVFAFMPLLRASVRVRARVARGVRECFCQMF